MITKADRGAYVKVRLRLRRSKSWSRWHGYEWQEWKEETWEGILAFGRDGTPKVDGNRISGHGLESEVLACEVVFRPAKNAVRYLCSDCGDTHPNRRKSPLSVRTHPVAVALDQARMPMHRTWGKSYVCSVCGNNGSNGIYFVPPSLWWITTETPDEEIEKALAGYQFSRVMKDAVMELCLWKCEAPIWNTQSRRYAITWVNRQGEYIRSEHAAPPPSGWWQRWIPIDELRPHSHRIVAHGGHVLFEAEATP